MFNSYTYRSNQTLNINAVSGTIVKTYKDSFILRFHKNSPNGRTILSNNPGMDNRGSSKPVVVLQIMLCGDDEYMAEIMWKEDFNKLFESEEVNDKQTNIK